MKKFFAFALINLLLLAGIYHDSLAEYYELRYHIYLGKLSAKFKILDPLVPENILNRLNNNNKKLILESSKLAADQSTPPKTIKIKTNIPNQVVHFDNKIFNQVIDSSSGWLFASHLKLNPIQTKQLSISRSSGVILLGDSLMQGLSARLCSYLHKEKIPCMNLSKQSSGLLHQRFYNYPQTLQKAQNARPGARVIILVGVNDLFDTFYKGKKLTFGTDEWINYYKELAAQLKGVDIWLALPPLREDKGASKAQWFNTQMQALSAELGIKYLNLLESKFNYYENIDGELVRIRAGDGIHFSTAGYDLLAKKLLENLSIN